MPYLTNSGKCCQTCKHFTFAEGKTSGNRNCYFKGKLFLTEGRCGCWKDTRTLRQKLLGKHPVKALCR